MPTLTAEAHAAILRKVAAKAVRDARAAWKKANEQPSERHDRAAFRACVFAARALRKAAAVSPGDAPQMLAKAKQLDAAAKKLQGALARG